MKKEKAMEFFKNFDKAMSEGDTLLSVYHNEKNGATIIATPRIEDEETTAYVISYHIYQAISGEGDENDNRLARILTQAVKFAHDVYNKEQDEAIEDCAKCIDVRICNEPTAIAYRKKHHIPKPKKK
jgi:hypothetical protein